MKLWEHQEKMISYLEDNISQGIPYAWWLAGCSTGKTITALELIKRRNARALIITTKSASSAWQRDNKHYGLPMLILTTGFDAPHNATAKTKIVQATNFLKEHNNGVIVINYDTAKMQPFADKIPSFDFDIVIADESHRLKTHNSKTTLMLSYACKDIPVKVLMTGTGWDRLTDIYSQARFFDFNIGRAGNGRQYYYTNIFDKHQTYNAFFDKHVNYYEPKRGMKIIDKKRPYKNVDTVMDAIMPFSLKIRTEDVHDLPDVLTIENTIKAHYSFYDDYNKLRDSSILEHEGETMTADFAVTLAMRLRMFTSGIFTPDANPRERMYTKGSQKLSTLVDYIDGTDEPIVIFTNFVDEVHLIRQAVNEEIAVLTGDANQLEDFHNGANRIIVCNIQAGSEGIDLSHCGNKPVRLVVYYSLPLSAIKYEQSLWRVRRVNNTNTNISISYMLVENTVDEAMYKALTSKVDMNQALLDYILTA